MHAQTHTLTKCAGVARTVVDLPSGIAAMTGAARACEGAAAGPATACV